MPRATLVLLCLALPWGALAAEKPSKTLKLTLETALQMALAKNFSIEVQRFDPKIAKQGVRRELGRFDPVFDITAERGEDRRRVLFDQGVHLADRNVSKLDRLSSGISGVTSWGTEYDLGYGTRRRSETLGLFRDNYDTTGTLALRQPLLRDFGPTANLAQVRIARNNYRVSEWQLRQRIIDVMTTTNFVYNDLQLAMENRRVAERSRELARQLYKDNQARENIGVKARLDVTQARAEVAVREEGVILAQRTVLDNENLLKQLTTTDIMAMLDVRVEIEPPPAPDFKADVPAGVRDALLQRPDYRQAILDLEQRHIRLAFQKNQLLPRIDLTGSLSLLGLDNDYGSSVDRALRRDQTSWTAGVIFSIPLGNRSARASVETVKLEVAKALVHLQELEQQIVVDVDNASGQITTSQERIASTMEARRLALESLDAGEARLKADTGTTFEVLELQKKLTEAEAAELRARSDYNKAVGEYHRQSGTTLRVHNVVLREGQ